jgi:hypothetical protein
MPRRVFHFTDATLLASSGVFGAIFDGSNPLTDRKRYAAWDASYGSKTFTTINLDGETGTDDIVKTKCMTLVESDKLATGRVSYVDVDHPKRHLTRETARVHRSYGATVKEVKLKTRIVIAILKGESGQINVAALATTAAHCNYPVLRLCAMNKAHGPDAVVMNADAYEKFMMNIRETTYE